MKKMIPVMQLKTIGMMTAAADTIAIKKYNAVHNKIQCDDGIAQELRAYFTFKAQNYRYHPLYKARKWNGDITLFSPRAKLLYSGLNHHVKKFCDDRNYDCIIDDDLIYDKEFSVKEAKDFIATLDLPSKFDTREYQIDSFVHCVRKKRSLFISPTGSGKSLIIYWLTRYYNTKTLIIVDSINLLNQMYSDFDDYGFDSESNVHRISAGVEKHSDKQILITTWQSAILQPKEWFDQFNLVIGDEAHRYKATSLKKIMENLTGCNYRFGFTGSLDGSQVNQLTLEGLFGEYCKLKSSKNLIDDGFLSNIEIKAIILKYSDDIRKSHTKDNYEDEIAFLYSNEKRNKFIENLTLSLKGNTIVLFQRVDTHGIPLHKSIEKRADVPVYYVSGKVDGDDREEIRKIVNTHDNSITVASSGTFSTGINIPNINSIVIAAPTKSVIRVLQTVGRGIRKTDIKSHCTIFDIADNLQWKRHQNYTLKHFSDRMKIYINEEFNYKLYHVDLSEGNTP